jgi:hypothetical protein
MESLVCVFASMVVSFLHLILIFIAVLFTARMNVPLVVLIVDYWPNDTVGVFAPTRRNLHHGALGFGRL